MLLASASTDYVRTTMVQEDSIFGAEPDDLRRLVRFGLEPDDTGAEEDASPLTASIDELMERPGARIGRYKLLRVLGEGGMGVVYLAQQDKPVTRQVALKVIKPGMDSKRVMARFEAEEQTLAMMEHPHVARVYDADLTGGGRPYFVMEYVKGIPITEHCDKYKLRIEERLRLFLHVCEAVQHAHQKGIIHRDLKPSNILVSIEGNEAVPKVIDFGVARAVSQQLTEKTLYTEQGQLIGTPEYMSPEQADLNNQDIDTRTDIYALGVVLYRLLAGVPPFDPQTLQAAGIEHMRKIICEEEPKTPSTRLRKTSVEESMESAQRRSTSIRALQRRLHGDLDWITLKAMEKDRIRRYESVGELTADIQRHLNHEAVLAGPPSTLYRIRKFTRRNRALVTGAAAVIAVLIVGTVVSTVFAIKADRARVEAQAVSDFLSGSVIELIDPYKVTSEEITRRSLLDAISENLEQDFMGPPLAEAQIRHTLGHAYWSIGVYELAAAYFERALEASRVHLGPEHATTLAWMETLGWVYHFQSRFREEEPLFQEALKGARRVWGEEHEQTGHFMWSLASVYFIQGRYKEAEPLSEKALKISMRQRDEEDRHTVETMSLVVWVYLFQGRYEEAEQLISKALAINLHRRDRNDWWTLTLKHQSAELYWNLGRYEEAEQLLLEVLNGRRRIYGEEHADTLFTMADLGRLCCNLGRYDEAESLFNEALVTARRVLGNTHLHTANSAHGLGLLYLSQGRYDKAKLLLETALEIVGCLFNQEHPFALKYKNDLGVLQREQQHYDKAESLLRQALDSRQRKLGEDHPACFESLHELAVLYKDQDEFDKAEPLLLQAVEGRRLKLGDTHPHTLESLKNLIELYEAWNKPEKAKEWRAKIPKPETVEQ
jgi:serine/threonine protein kinase/tetratricopeptide (TPR) repeat protein